MCPSLELLSPKMDLVNKFTVTVCAKQTGCVDLYGCVRFPSHISES